MVLDSIPDQLNQNLHYNKIPCPSHQPPPHPRNPGDSMLISLRSITHGIHPPCLMTQFPNDGHPGNIAMTTVGQAPYIIYRRLPWNTHKSRIAGPKVLINFTKYWQAFAQIRRIHVSPHPQKCLQLIHSSSKYSES